MNKKIYGYYTVGDRVFFRKVEALLYASTLLKSPSIAAHKHLFSPLQLVKWHFNTEVFDQYNWSNEPDETLDFYYQKRARDLREKYDVIIAYYSGGCDSHNMIMSFLNQNLIIDELVIHHVNAGIQILQSYNFDPKDARIQPLTETNLQILPRLSEIKKIAPNIKINLFDTTQKTIELFSKYQDGSWVKNVREELNPVDSAKYNFTCFDEYKSLIDTNKKIGIIVGLDKPSIRINNNKVMLILSDRRFNINLFYSEIESYSNAQVEFFYTSPDACDLFCKQAHTLMNWVLSSHKTQDMFTVHQFTPSLLLANNKLFLEENARALLYQSTWHKEWFQAKKSILDWHSEADLWYHLAFPANTIQGSCWLDGIRYVKENIHQSYLYENDGFIEFNKEYVLKILDTESSQNANTSN